MGTPHDVARFGAVFGPSSTPRVRKKFVGMIEALPPPPRHMASPFPKFDVGLKIAEITAIPTSFPLPKDSNVRLGIGRAVKRDAVIVKVRMESGIVGYGESNEGRAPGAVAALINTTLRTLVLGMDATDVVGVWNRIYSRQLASHGMGAGCSLAMSGLDMALWDIRAKAVGWPLYKLLGGAQKPIPAYAGGVSLGFQDPKDLVAEAKAHVDAGYKAIKLRLGDNVKDDLRRVEAARDAFGDDLEIQIGRAHVCTPVTQ